MYGGRKRYGTLRLQYLLFARGKVNAAFRDFSDSQVSKVGNGKGYLQGSMKRLPWSAFTREEFAKIP
jgi:hypothetical protein